MKSIKARFIYYQITQSAHIKMLLGLVALLVFLTLKWWYSQADTEALLFLLRPTSFLVHLFTNQDYIFLPTSGYHFPAINILINTSCAGGNWWLLAFLVGCFSGLNYLEKKLQLLLLIPGLLCSAYLVTLLVNSTRIIFSIFISAQFPENGAWLHLIEGIFIYLSSLIIWHLCCQYFFQKITSQS
jgi:exosortase K